MTVDDLLIALVVGYVAASAVTPLPELSSLLRRTPIWARWMFAGALAGVVAIHLDAIPQ